MQNKIIWSKMEFNMDNYDCEMDEPEADYGDFYAMEWPDFIRSAFNGQSWREDLNYGY